MRPCIAIKIIKYPGFVGVQKKIILVKGLMGPPLSNLAGISSPYNNTFYVYNQQSFGYFRAIWHLD